MKRILALVAAVVVVSAVPAGATTPSPRMIEVSQNVFRQMRVRVWTPNGRSSATLQCEKFETIGHGDTWIFEPHKKCPGSGAPRQVRVTVDAPGAPGPPYMVVRVWSPDGKRSTKWRCPDVSHGTLRGDDPAGDEDWYWMKGQCSVVP